MLKQWHICLTRPVERKRESQFDSLLVHLAFMKGVSNGTTNLKHNCNSEHGGPKGSFAGISFVTSVSSEVAVCVLSIGRMLG